MKILYSITKSEIGGAQVHVLELAKFMKNSGHQVGIVSFPGGWLESESLDKGIEFFANPYFSNSFNPFRILKSFSFVNNLIHSFKPDIVHCHSSFAGVITRLVVGNRIPTIFTAHSWAFTGGASSFRKIIAPISEKIVSKYTKKIICVSDYDKQLALRYKITSPEKLITIYNGIDSGNNLSQKQNSNTFISVGRLAYPKEFELLIESFVRANLPNKKLEIVGEGSDKEKILEKIKSLKAEDKVFVLGKLSQQEVRKKLSESSVFILISKHEGFPMTILEAMSTGLPVIASKVGGVPEEIDESCGILVSNNAEEISTAITKLSEENTNKKMGEASKRKFEANFTLEKFLSKTKKVYDEVLNS